MKRHRYLDFWPIVVSFYGAPSRRATFSEALKYAREIRRSRVTQ